MNNAIKFIQDTYQWAKENGYANNKSQFALLVGTNYSTLTQFLRGDPKQPRLDGSRTAYRVKLWRESVENKEVQPKVVDSSQDWEIFRREAALRIYCSQTHRSAVGAIAEADELIKKLQGR